jgi:predicted DNA-binding transcriptional regulator AlpA
LSNGGTIVAWNPAEIDMSMTNKTVLNFNKIISFQSTRKKKWILRSCINYFSQLFSRHCLCDWMVCVVTCILRLMYVLLIECQIVEKLGGTIVAWNPAEIDMSMTNKTVLNFNKIISFQSTRKKKW